MFTGIVKEMGLVDSVQADGDGARLRVSVTFAGDLAEGDSVAVNGVCLTAAALGDGWFEADAMNQTLDVTTLGGVAEGERVNLEPALRAGDALGGHIVQGHVDGVAEVTDVSEDGFARRVTVSLPEELRRYVVERGSVTLDGVSLTVAALTDDGVTVSLIPETLERTTLGNATAGTRLNVEVDVIARYAERMLQGFEPKGD
jgi:riboflavin synthase